MARDRARGPEPKRTELPRAFGDWISSFPWDLFVTLTFTEQLHPEQAGKLFGRWIGRLQRRLHHDVRWVRALEWQQREVPHFHALIWPVGEVYRVSLAYDWIEISGGGRADVQAYDEGRGAAAYLGKGLATGGGEVDYGGAWWPRAAGAEPSIR